MNTSPANVTARQMLDAATESMSAAISTMENAFAQIDFDQMQVSQIADMWWSLKAQNDAVKELQSRVYKMYDALDKGIFPAQMEKRDLDLIRVPELGRSFSVQQKTSASILDKEKGFEWLRDNGHGDLIQETVNAGTLASFARNLSLEQGIDLPDEIFKVSTYNTMGSNKYTPKAGK